MNLSSENQLSQENYRYHYERYMNYKMIADMHKQMYNYLMDMARYHYKMCMYYQNGGVMPELNDNGYMLEPGTGPETEMNADMIMNLPVE